MPVELRVTGADHKEFAAHLAGILALSFPGAVPASARPNVAPSVETTGGPSVPAPTSGPELVTAESTEQAPPKRRGRPKKAEEPEKPAEPEPETSDEAEEVEKAPAPSMQDVKAKMIELLDAKGDDAPVELLKKFGVKKISEIDPAKYADVIAAVEAELAGD